MRSVCGIRLCLSVLICDEHYTVEPNRSGHCACSLTGCAESRQLAHAKVHCAQHRLDGMLKHSDRVVVMEAGRVVEQGRPAELLGRRGSAFAELYRTAHPDAKGLSDMKL